jgi:hypothetical protein
MQGTYITSKELCSMRLIFRGELDELRNGPPYPPTGDREKPYPHFRQHRTNRMRESLEMKSLPVQRVLRLSAPRSSDRLARRSLPNGQCEKLLLEHPAMGYYGEHDQLVHHDRFLQAQVRHLRQEHSAADSFRLPPRNRNLSLHGLCRERWTDGRAFPQVPEVQGGKAR